MRYILSFVFICVVQTGFAQSQLEPGKKVVINGVATVHVERGSGSHPMLATAHIYHAFPAGDFSEVLDTMPANQNELWLRCPVRLAQTVFVWLDSTKLELFLIPGDTVHVHIGVAERVLAQLPISFSGRTKDIQRFYQAQSERFPQRIDQLKLNCGGNAPNLSVFAKKIDSLCQTEQHFWRQYQQENQLPAWFVQYQTDAIRYTDAWLRLYMIWYQRDYQSKKQTVPADYYVFLTNLPLRNEQAQYNDTYMKFVEQYVVWRDKALPTKSDPDADRMQMLTIARRTFGDDLSTFFWLWYTGYAVQSNSERAREYLTKLPFPAQYQYLVAYLLEQAQSKIKILQPGDKAPNFILADTQDSLVSLTQFKGNVVYLSFWFPTCGGCIHEFPFENKLVREFTDKPVKIISICIGTTPNKWEQAIKKFDLKTINLFANQSWQQSLEKKYAIGVYPHYVLIGPDGKVVENFATRPSKQANARIKEVLAQMGKR